MNKRLKISLFLAILVGFSSSLFADTRSENIDLFLVLDKSLSMEEEIEAVKEYVSGEIINETLIPGDLFVLIQFYGEAEILFAENVPNDMEKTVLQGHIGEIYANGQYTDIGNALDTLKASLKNYEHSDRRKYLLLVTDGQQEAPETSKYYSADGSFNHEFLENAKTIQKEGWKIQVLGIGTASAAQEIAEQLAGGYVETDENPTPEELTEITEELLSVIELAGEVKLTEISGSGSAELILPLTVAGYTEAPLLRIGSITLNSEESEINNLKLAGESSFTLPREGSSEIRIPLEFGKIAPGRYTGSLTFTFSGTTVFTPAFIDIAFSIPEPQVPAPEKTSGFFARYWWIILIIAAALIIAVLVIIFVKKGVQGKPCQFRVYADNEAVTKTPVVLKNGDEIYISRDGINFTVGEQTKKSIVRIQFIDGDLQFHIVDSEWVKTEGDIPPSVLNEKIKVKLKSGIRKELYFKAA